MNLFRHIVGIRQRRSHKRAEPVKPRRRFWSLTFEALEDRILLSPALVQDINPGAGSSNPRAFAQVNGTLFFVADDGTSGPELWKTDGTAAGTVLVKDINPGSAGSSPFDLTNFNGTLFFDANDGTHGAELWKSDGTAANTVMVSDINPGSTGSTPTQLTVVGNTLYFVATDQSGLTQLWKSDGSPGGTALVKAITTTMHASPYDLTNFNGTLFFGADDGTGAVLWKSDGTAGGTVKVTGVPPGGVPHTPLDLLNENGTLFFTADDGIHGRQLWNSDGTVIGTYMLRDLNPSGDAFPSFQLQYPGFVDVNGSFYFTATDGSHGFELWKCDGSPVGTAMVKDINPNGDSNPTDLVNVNGTLYFRATDGVNGVQLWKSDGTSAGTQLVQIINPSGDANPDQLANVNGELFFSATDPTHGNELWQSGGTSQGTLVQDIIPGVLGSFPSGMTNFNGTVFFAATDIDHGTELWSYSPTAAPPVIQRSGDITSDTAWSNTSIQEVTGDVHVLPGVTLTIQPGTIVQFDDGTQMTVDGTLHAVGTATSGIVFTSIHDGSDKHGPNTATNGAWKQIQFLADSTGNVLEYVDVRYAGGSAPADVVDSGAPLTLSNSVLENSAGAGLRIVGANPTLTSDTYQDNTGAAVSMDLASHPSVHGATVTNNGLNAAVLDGGSLPASTAWDNPDLVYVLSAAVTVPQGVTLTVGPGQVIKLTDPTTAGAGALVVNGTLNAAGTEAQPIVFTSLHDDSAGGDTDNNGTTSGAASDWSRIEFGSTSTSNVLDHVETRFAGGNGAAASIVVTSAPLQLSNSVLRNSATAGMRFTGSTPTLTGDTFQDNAGAALSMDLASHPAIHAVSFSNNKVNGLLLDAGNLPASTAWDNTEVVYLLSSAVTVPQGVTLTVAPGQIIKLDDPVPADRGGGALLVNGTLTAVGTADAPIIFTSPFDGSAGGLTNNDKFTPPFTGNWSRIEFGTTSTGNVLDHVAVRYAGGNSALAAIVNNGGPLQLTNSIVQDSASGGLRMVASAPTLTSDTFQDNVGAALSSDLGSHPAIHSVAFTNNGVNGLALDGGSLPASISWDNTEVVYWLSGETTVPASVTLTIAPGQVIKPAGVTGQGFPEDATIAVKSRRP